MTKKNHIPRPFIYICYNIILYVICDSIINEVNCTDSLLCLAYMRIYKESALPNVEVMWERYLYNYIKGMYIYMLVYIAEWVVSWVRDIGKALR